MLITYSDLNDSAKIDFWTSVQEWKFEKWASISVKKTKKNALTL